MMLTRLELNGRWNGQFSGCKSYVQEIEVLVRDWRPGVFVFKWYKTYFKSFVIYVNNEIMQIMLLNCKLHVP